MADPEGVRSNPPLRPNYFVSMGIYLKSWVKLTKRTPLCKFEPPFKKSWIPPGFPRDFLVNTISLCYYEQTIALWRYGCAMEAYCDVIITFE